MVLGRNGIIINPTTRMPRPIGYGHLLYFTLHYKRHSSNSIANWRRDLLLKTTLIKAQIIIACPMPILKSCKAVDFDFISHSSSGMSSTSPVGFIHLHLIRLDDQVTIVIAHFVLSTDSKQKRFIDIQEGLNNNFGVSFGLTW